MTAAAAPMTGPSVQPPIPPPPPPPPGMAPAAAPPPKSRAKLLIAALAGFLIVLLCAGWYIYGAWPRRAHLVASTAPPPQQESVPQPTPEPTPEATPTPLETPAPTPTPTPEPTPVQEPVPPPAPVHHTAPPQVVTRRPASAPQVRQLPSEQAEPPREAPVQSQPRQSAPPPLKAPEYTAPQQQPAQQEPVQQQPVQQQTAQPPPPAVRSAPARRVYSGPQSGWLTWSGKLDKNQTLTIDGGTASTGSLTGELPGVPVNVVVDVTNIGLQEEPNPRNNFKRLVLRSLGKHNAIRIHWTLR
jgi:hypothetical protein